MTSARFARGRSFYQELEALIESHAGSLFIDSEERLEERFGVPSLVGTVSGTVGLEASIRGINTVLYGDSWFEDFPNTYSPDSRFVRSGSILNRGAVISYEDFCRYTRSALDQRSYLLGCIYNQSADWSVQDSVSSEHREQFFANIYEYGECQ